MSGKGMARKAYVPPPQRILTSPDRVKNIRSIVCLGLPPHMCDKEAVRRHFSQFGRITRTTVTPAKSTATVHFATHDFAAAAKQNGTKNMPESVKIFWSQSVGSRRSSTGASSAASSSSSRRITRVATSTNLSSVGRDEVEEELRSMGDQQDYVVPHRDQSKGNVAQTRMDRFLRVSGVPKKKSSDTPPPSSTFTHPVASSSVLRPATVASTVRPATVAPPAPVVRPATSVPPASVAETAALMDVIRKAAFSNEERYNVLEARDKLLRLRRAKQFDLASAQRTVGTCPDMCPEKERYMRETRHQVGSYEQLQSASGIVHALAVKQYSRSSADQELPLPHELRPSPVLRATMNHLLAHVASRVDIEGESLGDWYFFLWDRTRAIRKDITQQELCDGNAVTLVEQCARFHIACSARLAQEELGVFDPKINTENLAKCLQTLKHMYHDMALRGEECTNEPEFRAYIALLNLNTGDAMWEVQQLSAEVRASPQVQLAVQAYLALSHHNYVRFFKLVRCAGFLAAAILIRYFTQARSKALEILTRALCSSARGSVQFPLVELVRQLGFESGEEAADFSERHGLEASTEHGYVALSRLSFSHPDTSVPVKRARNLVERQLQVSLAEVIAGCSMAQISAIPREPVSSFEPGTGMLTASARELLDPRDQPGATLIQPVFGIPAPSQPLFGLPTPNQPIFGGEPSQPLFPQVNVFSQSAFSFSLPPAPVPTKPALDPQVLQKRTATVLQQILTDVIPGEVRQVATPVLKDWHLAVMARQAGNTCMYQVTMALIRELCGEALESARMEQRARLQALEALRLRAERQREQLNAFAHETAVSLLLEVVQEEVGQVVCEEVRRKEQLEALARSTLREVICQVVHGELSAVALPELAEARRKRSEEIQALFARLKARRVRRVLLRWRELALRARRMWERMQDFPAGRSSLSPSLQAAEMSAHPDGTKLTYPGTLGLSFPKQRRDACTQSFPLVEIANVRALLHPSPLPSVPGFLLGPEPACAPATWHMTLSLPASSPTLRAWAERCLAKKPLSSQGGCSVFESRGMLLKFEVLVGPRTPECTPHGVALVVSEGTQEEAASRLGHLLSSPPSSPVPVAILMLGGGHVDDTMKDVLQRKGESGALYHVRTFSLPHQPQSQQELEAAMRWLASKGPPQLDCLVATPLSAVLASLLRASVWQSVVAATLTPSLVPAALSTLHKSPDVCLRLANAQLECVAKALEASEVRLTREEGEQVRAACPALAPHWRHGEYLHHAAQLVRDLQLPLLSLPPSRLAEMNWTKLLSVLAEFCKKVVPQPGAADSMLSWLFQQMRSLSVDGFAAEELPWSRLIESVLEEVVSRQDLRDPVLKERNLVVALPRSVLTSFLTADWCSQNVKSMIKELVPPAPAPQPLEVEGKDKRKRELEEISEKLETLLRGVRDSKAKFARLEGSFQDLSASF